MGRGSFLRADHLPGLPLGSLKTYWGRGESLISKLSTELALEGLTHKHPLNNNADVHWTVNNKYIPEGENTHLLNAGGAKGSTNVIRCNNAGYNEMCTSAKTKYSSIFKGEKNIMCET